MSASPFTPKSLTETLGSFEKGVNSGVSPLLLPKNQLADARNVTVRGTFATHRPPIRKMTMSYAFSTQGPVEDGLFQSASYFKPDTGLEVLMAAMSGRLFRFDISGTVATVSEATVPSDPNPAAITQAWMWQAERWLIWQAGDGTSLPVFYDGLTSRRSTGPQVCFGIIDGTGFAVPVIGGTAAIALTAPYTGPFGVTVTICDGLYKLVGKTSFNPHAGFGVSVTNNNDTPGNIVPTGTAAVINTSTPAITTTVATLLNISPGSTNNYTPYRSGHVTITLTLNTPYTGQVGNLLSITGIGPPSYEYDNNYIHGNTMVWRVTNISGSQITLNNTTSFEYFENNSGDINGQIGYNYPIGTLVRSATSGSTQLGTIVAVVDTVPNTGFVVPVVGASITIYFSQAYTQALPQQISIGGKSYTVTAIIPSAPAGGDLQHLDAINLNDSTTDHSTPQHANCAICSIPEISPGRMGAYGMGRNWYSLPAGISFRATDIVGSSAGTAAFNFRDAVLRESHNQFLTTGDFRLPGANGQIRAMKFVAILDKSLGQGPLQVLTSNVVFSCNAPVDDTVWQDLTNPILTETLKPKGGLSQNSTVNANSDLFFRAPDGIRSEILGQRAFATWGNVAQSREVAPTIDADDQTLLKYSSAINFDNRLLMTAHPVQGVTGVYHDSLVALNFDPVSSLQGKGQSIWEGVWTGLNVLQLLVGEFNSVERAFSFCYNTTTHKTELWELQRTDDATTDGGNAPITMEIQSGSMFQENKEYKQLEDGEIRVDRMVGTVRFDAYYKPDQWPNWVLWHSWTETHAGGTLGFRPRMGLGQPSPTDIDSENDRPLRNFYTMQFRLLINGHCRFLGATFGATTVPQPQFATPK